MCSVGVVFTAGSLLNTIGVVSITHGHFVALAACAAAVGLLFAALDHSSNRPLARRHSSVWAAVCVMAFIAATMSAQSLVPVTRFLLVLLGVCASAFTVTPFFATLNRLRQAPAAGVTAALGAALPLIYEQYYRALWGWLVGPTTYAVAAVVRMFGHTVSTNFGTRLDDAGDVWDHYGYVATPEFSIRIGAWCGGFEGMSLFLFLLASFVLLDWRFFSRTDKLWLPFLATIPYLFTINVLRIAAVLMYAILIAGEVDQDAARQVAVETFHSNAGWVIYSLAFGPYLSAVYWWARRKIRIPEVRTE